MLNKPSMDIEKLEKDFNEEMNTIFCKGKLEGYEFDLAKSIFFGEMVELRFNKGNEHYNLFLLQEQIVNILEEHRINKADEKAVREFKEKYGTQNEDKGE